ncbi:MAG TPA: hypothetical protein VGN13_12435 [Solirubrobacteraceae bacterium]|jgi:hypothetical protein
MDVKLVTDGARMAELLRSPTGVVGRHLIARSTIVQAAAKAQAPRKTGCLQDTIVKRVEEDAISGFAIRIVSDTTPCSPSRTSYSYYVHEGTHPHVIEAKSGSLGFYWENGPDGPGMYYFKRVQHPGTRANRFLSDNLRLFAA